MDPEPQPLPPQALPGTLGSLRPPALHVWLFVLTATSALLAGTMLDTRGEAWEVLLRSAAFAASVLAILLAHEMGHFLAARHHGVDATWPLFIPAPYVSFLGTFGAVIRLRELPRSRRALIDVAAAGPIAGFLVTLPILYVGLVLSQVVPEPPHGASWTLAEAVRTRVETGAWPDVLDAIELGDPLLLSWMASWLYELPAGQTLNLHPVALAGWFGLLLTALNLLPLGQLDGGHLLYAASPRLHARLGPLFSAGLFAMGLFTPFFGWAAWGILTGTLLSQHPPLPGDEAAQGSLGLRTRLLLAAAFAVFLLCFSASPIGLYTPP